MNITQKNEAHIFPLFSKVVYVKQTNINCEKILHLTNEQNMVSGTPSDANKKHLSLSSKNKKVLDQNKYQDLKKEIMKEFYEYAHHTLHYKNNKFKMTTSWFTKSDFGQESNYHHHNNCMFSGCLYLNVDDDSGGINFNNFENLRFKLQATKYDVFNCVDYTIIPKTGTIIFFPSELNHKILINTSKLTRISLAFNFLPIGKIGDTGDSVANIK